MPRVLNVCCSDLRWTQGNMVLLLTNKHKTWALCAFYSALRSLLGLLKLGHVISNDRTDILCISNQARKMLDRSPTNCRTTLAFLTSCWFSEANFSRTDKVIIDHIVWLNQQPNGHLATWIQISLFIHRVNTFMTFMVFQKVSGRCPGQ